MSIDNQKLILTPNGYKAGKNYSIKPTDGSGDFTMSRGTSKTRVNKDKVIESVGNDVLPADYTNADCPVLAIEPQRTNLLPYSEEFDNAAWDKTPSVFVTGNTQVINNLVFYEVNFTSSSSGRLSDGLTLPTSNHTLSFYLLKGTRDKIRLNYSDPQKQPFLDAELTDQPQRFELTFQGNGSFEIVSLQGEGGTTPGTIWVSAAQLEQGRTATSYIPTSGSNVTRNQDVLNKDYSSIIEPTYSVLLDVEGDKSRLKIEDNDTGFDLPLEGSGKIVMVVDNEITFHFPDTGQANTTVTYEKPADLRNLEILSKLGRTGLAILSIENGVISQSKIDDWVSGNVTSEWLEDYSNQTNFNEEFREQDWDYFPAIDLSNGTDFNFAWLGNNLTSFPAIDLSSGTIFSFAWRDNNLTSFPAIDLSNGTNFESAWYENNLTSFPAIDLSNGTSFAAAWQFNNLTSFPAIDLSNGTDFFRAWFSNNLTSFPAIDLSNGTNFEQAWISNNLTSFPANMFDNNNARDYDRAFENNDLDQQSVDDILVSIEESAQANNITNGTLDIDGGTNATPSATGQAAADSLRNTFGWTVNLNGY